MKKPEWSRWAPPGLDLHMEGTVFIWGMALSALFSLSCPARCWREADQLYETGVDGVRTLIPGAVMPDFVQVLGPALVGFLLLALCMAAMIPIHYSYHYRGSRSIYLMRRLPSRWEVHRRCWTLPVLAILCCAVAAFLLLLLYFAIYMHTTPERSLTPHQWEKIWSVISCWN